MSFHTCKRPPRLFHGVWFDSGRRPSGLSCPAPGLWLTPSDVRPRLPAACNDIIIFIIPNTLVLIMIGASQRCRVQLLWRRTGLFIAIIVIIIHVVLITSIGAGT